jgi:hypothetical protein
MSHMNALQEWYALMCDGDWEHSFGIRIDTVDNPGWVVSIDIIETPASGQICNFDREFPAGEWLQVKCDGKTFEIACGPRSLDRGISAFLRFADQEPSLSAQERGELGAGEYDALANSESDG